ncbi:MAG: serine/threonine-protein kinase [Acidobacteriota bacterium]
MDSIGKYEILEKIGEGGFGVVYKGRDPFIKRIVAIKTCSSEDSGVRERFFLEARIAGNLHHPNVVMIHDFGLEDETPFLVQEFLDGEDLDAIIDEKRPLPIEQKIDHLYEVARGLGYAHSNDVIHRDIKPANIRVLSNGRVKVMDFGIAKLKGQASGLTETGTTVGTVSYLSPEQLRGLELDQRSDIFSYGILAYELIEGGRPFEARNFSELCRQILMEDPKPLDSVVPQCPKTLADIVQKCLAKDRDDRYDSFAKVQQELMALRSTLSGAPPVWEQAFVNTDQVQIEEAASEPVVEAPAATEEEDTVVPPLPPKPPPGAPPPPPMLTMKRTGSVPQVNPETTKYASELIEEAMASLRRNELHAARERLTEANRIDPGNIPAIALLSKVERALN